jgi:Domain of unknown function (DUF4432)
MRVLQSDELRVALTPLRGEIRSLVHRPTGEELLFQSPWKPIATRADLRSGEEWTAAWPGGWTLLFPNAGNRCTFGGRDHGVHGAASLARWSVEGESADAVTLAWTDASELAVRRIVRLDGGELTVATEIENRAATPQPYLMVEHLILGAALAGPGARMATGPARVLRMDDEGAPLGAPEPWPTAEDWTVVPDAPFSRFGALHELERREVTVSRGALACTLRWTGLPAMWLWHEHRASDGFPLPITALGLEPSASVASTGLARAVEQGEAPTLAPGARATVTTALVVQFRGPPADA